MKKPKFSAYVSGVLYSIGGALVIVGVILWAVSIWF